MKRILFVYTVCLLLPLPGRAQELVIYTMPSPVRYNWRSPHTVFISYLENILKPNRYRRHKHPLGHLIVELRDSSRQALVGATARNSSDLKNAIIREKQGLGAFFSSYVGLLETEDDNRHQLEDRYRHGHLAYIRMLLTQKTFNRLWQYLEEYRARGYDTIYNGENNPRAGKGAGCSAFAVSFLELGNLLDTAILNQWQIHLDIQEKLIGTASKEKNISLLKLAFTQRWARKHKHTFRSVSYYEPTFVYKWIKEKHHNCDTTLLYETEQRGKAPGLVFDKRHIATPEEDIWIHNEISR